MTPKNKISEKSLFYGETMHFLAFVNFKKEKAGRPQGARFLIGFLEENPRLFLVLHVQDDFY